MGHTDMKQSNQSTNEEAIDLFRKGEDRKFPKTNGHVEGAKISVDGNDAAHVLSSSVWSSDGLLSSSRLFQRSSSTPPTHVDVHQPSRKGSGANNLSQFALRECVEENNQEEDTSDRRRQDLVMPIGKHIQRAWSAPPVPDNFDSFFTKQTDDHDNHRSGVIGFDSGGLHGIAENGRAVWIEESCGSDRSLEKTSIATISPLGSPAMVEGRQDMGSLSNGTRHGTSFGHRGFFPQEKRPSSPFMTLVDRVQEDFPRTPSPVFGCPAGSVSLPSHMVDHSMTGAMKQLRIDNNGRCASDNRSAPRRNDRAFTGSGMQPRAHDLRQPQRVPHHANYAPPYPVVAPPGFQAPAARGIYGSPMMADTRGWQHGDDHHAYSGGRFQVAPMEYGMPLQPARASFKGDFYSNKFGGGLYGHLETPARVFQGQGPPVCPTPLGYDMHEHHHYNIPQPVPMYRSKSGPPRRHEFSVHPAHSYSSTSLLEEFKNATKSDKWDLRTIQGHLLQFARDQTGSRFIQQKLEKADDRVREDAFNEVFPDALGLMTDVFGNYVIQKFFDHGSAEQQRRLVGMMKKNMVSLALQVYGCRVIQKALEVNEQLLLIREMRGHVLKCVVDQNGNHVLQKCIEAASWKKCMNAGDQQVLGEDIQFIIDDFVGQAYALSTHAYGCRVIQRVLEHCSADQIRPIVNEIIFKCRDLVKDQFGNYVVQHVICHGEVDQRNVVMQAILPDVAKWSQHKYASNVVEACLECATTKEISQIVELILDCDVSGSSCALLPMMKHMYGNYVVQKLLDRADRNDRQRIVRIIQHNADYLKRFTYGKHVLSRLEREMSSGHREVTSGRFY